MSSYFRVGFTGSREIVSGDAEKWVREEMQLLDLKIRLQLGKLPALHHGDCVGADALAHTIAGELGWRRVVHPPIDSRHRAFCEGASKTLRAQKYLARDRSIVKACSIILGLPGTPLIESDCARTFGLEASVAGRLSGTWYTLLRAMSEGREVRVYGPPPW